MVIRFARYAVWRMNLSTIFFFFQCQCSRAISFGQGWGFKLDSLPFMSYTNIAKLVVEPPLPPGLVNCSKLKIKMSIQIALTLECIWTQRNRKVFKRPCSSLLLTLKNLDSRFVEHVATMEEECESESFHKHNLILWKPPSQGCVKLNTDAAVKASYSAIAVIARDAYEFIIKAWALCVDTADPVIAEAQVIKWALDLAKLESFPKIIVESDSKMCIDALVDN
jgi:hypothetical protein